MKKRQSRGPDLNELCRLVSAGDEAAATHFFSLLRVRFLKIAKHRVPKDEADDLVQEGLRIVHEKLHTRSSSSGTLSWCLLILRNVIGNYYKRQTRQGRHVDFDETIHSRPLHDRPADASSDEQERQGVVDQLARGLAVLSESHPRCGVFFTRILTGMDELGHGQEMSKHTLALVQDEYPEMTPNSFYVALHRCRARLREILIGLAEGDNES